MISNDFDVNIAAEIQLLGSKLGHREDYEVARVVCMENVVLDLKRIRLEVPTLKLSEVLL